MRYLIRESVLKALKREGGYKDHNWTAELFVFGDEALLDTSKLSIGGDPLVEIKIQLPEHLNSLFDSDSQP